LLQEAEATDAAEDELYGADRRGDELPEELTRRETRLAKLREAKAALEAEAKEREQARRAEMEAEGRKPRAGKDGRDPFAPKPTAQRNFTDPDSKIMKASDGAFHQSYNAQAIVDSDSQVIVAAELSNQAPDCPALEGALSQLDANLAAIEAELAEHATLSADVGYFSADNVRITAAHGLDPHIATGRQKHSDPKPISPRGRIPKDASPRQRMARKLKTKKGHAVYARRKVIVEPVFGQMQTVQNAKQLLLRGQEAARDQWRFHCAVHNLLKLHRAGGLALIGAG
jgi:IS5 family transposase